MRFKGFLTSFLVKKACLSKISGPGFETSKRASGFFKNINFQGLLKDLQGSQKSKVSQSKVKGFQRFKDAQGSQVSQGLQGLKGLISSASTLVYTPTYRLLLVAV